MDEPEYTDFVDADFVSPPIKKGLVNATHTI